MWRTPDVEEFAGYVKAMQDTVESAAHWQGRHDPETVIRKFAEGSINVVIIEETYALIYVVASPWYNDKALDFYELGVYRVGTGNARFVSVTQAMEGIARQCGALRIIVGTSLPTNKESLVRLYERHGFKLHAYALFKDVDYGT